MRAEVAKTFVHLPVGAGGLRDRLMMEKCASQLQLAYKKMRSIAAWFSVSADLYEKTVAFERGCMGGEV